MSREQEKMRGQKEAPFATNALLFKLAVSNCFKHIADSVSEGEFLQVLTILKSNVSVARKLHEAMVATLYKSMENELTDIFQDGHLQDSLTELSRLIEEATIPPHEQAWRPPGDVKLHLRSLDAQKMKEEIERLESRVNEMECENKSLMKIIEAKRAKICATNERMMQILSRTPIAFERMNKRLDELENCLTELQMDSLSASEASPIE